MLLIFCLHFGLMPHILASLSKVVTEFNFSFLIRMFAEKLSENVIQSVIDLLFEQLKLLMENASKLILLEKSENASEPVLEQKELERTHKRKQNEAALCYFIKFLRRVAVTKAAQKKLVSSHWIELYMAIVSFSSDKKEFSHFSLRTRMLTSHLLTFVLPACEDDVLIEMVRVIVII